MANQIITVNDVEKFNIESLDSAITSAVNHLTEATTSGKALAIDFQTIKALASGTDRLKVVKFPVLVERIFKGAYDGSTAYKYAQCAEMFAEQPDIWDFYSISKLQILMNCENSTAVKEGKSAYDFHVWYADSINAAKNKAVEDWKVENEKVLAKIDSATDEETKDLWREKLTPCPDSGFDVPEKDTDAYKEYRELMFTAARKLLTKFNDKELRNLVKAYRGSGCILNTTSGKAEEIKTESKPKQKEEKKEVTPDILRQEAHAALLAYTSTFTDKVPKTLASALELLSKGGEK